MTKDIDFHNFIQDNDINTAIEVAKKGELSYGEISEGLYHAFCENLPELWIAISDNNPIEPLNLLNMMEENGGCLHVEMVRLWLSCKPSRDLIDECLSYVSWTTEEDIQYSANITDRSDDDYTSIKSMDEKETLLLMLQEAGADTERVLASLIADNRFYAIVKLVEQGMFTFATLPYFIKHDKLDLAEKVYAKKPHAEWMEHVLGNNPETDAWLLKKPAKVNLKGSHGAKLLYTFMQADDKEKFDYYLPEVNIRRRFECDEGETTLANVAVHKKDWHYLNALLERGAKCSDKIMLTIALKNQINDDNLERVETLINLGAKPDSECLRIATLNNSTDMVAFLLKHGTDPHLEQNSAMLEARRHSNAELEKLLLDAGAPPLADDPQRPKLIMPDDTTDMKALWSTWLEFYRLNIRTGESPKNRFWGESAKRIREREKALGIKLPKDVKTMYRLSGGGLGQFFGFEGDFLTLGSMEQYYDNNVGATGKPPHDDDSLNNDEEYGNITAYPPDSSVRDHQRHWVPIVEFGEFGMLCIDYTPGETGTMGQIICTFPSHWTTKRYRLASSMTDLVAMIMQRVADGKFYIDTDLFFESDTGEHFIDSGTGIKREKILLEVLVETLYPESLKSTP